MASGYDCYQITGKVCPPKLPMDSISTEDWSAMPSSLVASVFTETPVQSKRESLLPCCALSSQANVLLSSDNHSSVVYLPYLFCNFCDYHTDSKTAMLHHVAEKHVFKCKLCGFISITRWNLVQHQLSKHLDAEEVKPIVSSLSVNLNTSQLHRNLQHLSQSMDTADSTRKENSEFTGSVSSVQSDNEAASQTGALACSPGMKILNRETSRPNAAVSRREEKWNGQLKRKSDKTDTDRESIKKPRTISIGIDKIDAMNVRCDASFHQIPHFLDGSDSSVTSSSNMSNSSPRISQEDYIRNGHSESKEKKISENPCTYHMPSFLTEPLISPSTIEQINSASLKQIDSPVSSRFGMEPFQWYYKEDAVNDGPRVLLKKDVSETLSSSPEVLQTSSTKPNHILPYSEDNLKRARSNGRSRSLSPNLSVLSGEKLQKQFEEVVSKSPGFSFLDSTSAATQNKVDAGHCKSRHESPSATVFESECLEMHPAASDFSNVIENADMHRKKFSKGSKDEVTCENFLMSPERGLGCGTAAETEEKPIPDSNCYVNNHSKACAVKEFCDEDKKQHKKTERYDLLRKLLFKKTTDKTVATKVTEKQDSKVVETFSEEFSNEARSLSAKESSLGEQNQGKDTCYTKLGLSDLTLKELLTQDFQTSTQPLSAPLSEVTESIVKEGPIFLVCGYCNFESSNRANFKRHIERCNNHFHNITGICDPDAQGQSVDSIKSEADSEIEDVTFVKYECPDVTEVINRENSDRAIASRSSSGSFVASKVLKGLSNQYFESSRVSNNTCISDTFQEKTDLVTDPQQHTVQSFDFIEEKLLVSHPENVTDFGLSKNNQRNTLEPDTVMNDENGEENMDNVLESDGSSSQDSSDPDYKPNLVCSMKKKGRKRCRKSLYQKKNQFVAKRQAHDPLARHQPHIHLSCLHCSFASKNKTNMRQHLIEDHPHSVPYAMAVFFPQKTALVYFCKGNNSECTFLSCEPVEILEHIKLCYSGHLDSFVENGSACTEWDDYQQVLLSVGIAWKILDPTPVTYCCLRCSFSKTNFQRVAYHVSINHAKNVAGILLINQILTETRIRMVCLVCNAHIPVKMWATHPCRQLRKSNTKNSINTVSTDTPDAPLISTLEIKARLSHALKSRKSGINDDYCSDLEKVSAVCDLMAAENKNNLGAAKRSRADQDTNPRSCLEASIDSEIINSPGGEIIVKKEIPDIDGAKGETVDNVPEYFPENLQQTGNVHRHIPDTNTILSTENVPTKNKTFSSNETRTSFSGSSVLENLLTAPRATENSAKSYSLLQNLLKSPLTLKEKELSVSSPTLSSNVSSRNPPSNAKTQCVNILKNLSTKTRSQSHPETLVFNDQPLTNAANPQSHSKAMKIKHGFKSMNTAMKQASNLPSTLINHHSSTQIGQSFPVNSTMTSLSVSVKRDKIPTLPEPSPPLIPQPPPLPLLPPLSPSPPPTCIVADVPPKENQVSPAPFTNLLRGLLSKPHQCPNQ